MKEKYTLDYLKTWLDREWTKEENLSSVTKIKVALYMDDDKLGSVLDREELGESCIFDDFVEMSNATKTGMLNTARFHSDATFSKQRGQAIRGARIHTWDEDENETVRAFGAGNYTADECLGMLVAITTHIIDNESAIYYFPKESK